MMLKNTMGSHSNIGDVDDRVLNRLERSLELMEADYARTLAAAPVPSVRMNSFVSYEVEVNVCFRSASKW
jgi:hypothetical protein